MQAGTLVWSRLVHIATSVMSQYLQARAAEAVPRNISRQQFLHKLETGGYTYISRQQF